MDFPLEILLKYVLMTGGLMLFIRFFARGRRKPIPNSRAPLPPQAIVGGYQLHSAIADGGTATVYRALDPQGKHVAIKIPHSRLLADKNFIATFESEAEIGVTLQHPSIVRVLETGSYATEQFKKIPYFVMELLQGEDLRTRILRDGQMEPQAAAQVARCVADALGWAHQRGVVHRDITPRNIFITDQNQIKVMDFGISTVFDRVRKKRDNEAMYYGTPPYLAPERIDGEQNDPRSDLYALGCVFYEMVVGEPPFVGENAQAVMLMQQKAHVVRPNREYQRISAEMEAIIMKLLEKDPKKRYQSAAEVTAAIADLRSEV